MQNSKVNLNFINQKIKDILSKLRAERIQIIDKVDVDNSQEQQALINRIEQLNKLINSFENKIFQNLFQNVVEKDVYINGLKAFKQERDAWLMRSSKTIDVKALLYRKEKFGDQTMTDKIVKNAQSWKDQARRQQEKSTSDKAKKQVEKSNESFVRIKDPKERKKLDFERGYADTSGTGITDLDHRLNSKEVEKLVEERQRKLEPLEEEISHLRQSIHDLSNTLKEESGLEVHTQSLTLHEDLSTFEKQKKEATLQLQRLSLVPAPQRDENHDKKIIALKEAIKKLDLEILNTRREIENLDNSPIGEGVDRSTLLKGKALVKMIAKEKEKLKEKEEYVNRIKSLPIKPKKTSLEELRERRKGPKVENLNPWQVQMAMNREQIEELESQIDEMRKWISSKHDLEEKIQETEVDLKRKEDFLQLAKTNAASKTVTDKLIMEVKTLESKRNALESTLRKLSKEVLEGEEEFKEALQSLDHQLFALKELGESILTEDPEAGRKFKEIKENIEMLQVNLNKGKDIKQNIKQLKFNPDALERFEDAKRKSYQEADEEEKEKLSVKERLKLEEIEKKKQDYEKLQKEIDETKIYEPDEEIEKEMLETGKNLKEVLFDKVVDTANEYAPEFFGRASINEEALRQEAKREALKTFDPASQKEEFSKAIEEYMDRKFDEISSKQERKFEAFKDRIKDFTPNQLAVIWKQMEYKGADRRVERKSSGKTDGESGGFETTDIMKFESDPFKKMSDEDFARQFKEIMDNYNSTGYDSEENKNLNRFKGKITEDQLDVWVQEALKRQEKLLRKSDLRRNIEEARTKVDNMSTEEILERFDKIDYRFKSIIQEEKGRVLEEKMKREEEKLPGEKKRKVVTDKEVLVDLLEKGKINFEEFVIWEKAKEEKDMPQEWYGKPKTDREWFDSALKDSEKGAWFARQKLILHKNHPNLSEDEILNKLRDEYGGPTEERNKPKTQIKKEREKQRVEPFKKQFEEQRQKERALPKDWSKKEDGNEFIGLDSSKEERLLRLTKKNKISEITEDEIKEMYNDRKITIDDMILWKMTVDGKREDYTKKPEEEVAKSVDKNNLLDTDEALDLDKKKDDIKTKNINDVTVNEMSKNDAVFSWLKLNEELGDKKAELESAGDSPELFNQMNILGRDLSVLEKKFTDEEILTLKKKSLNITKRKKEIKLSSIEEEIDKLLNLPFSEREAQMKKLQSLQSDKSKLKEEISYLERSVRDYSHDNIKKEKEDERLKRLERLKNMKEKYKSK